MIPTDFAKNVHIYKKYIRRVEFRYFVYKKKKKNLGGNAIDNAAKI